MRSRVRAILKSRTLSISSSSQLQRQIFNTFLDSKEANRVERQTNE
ncbi:unnamed protein product [Haemonchus placei]|uniref:Uncharacterized protein n=1 Tax=Haemonchus placei TaxID=6290 RepID=A0A0N4WX01_HAEPC|nr:unnamed protein product [Haemonchus placei]